MSSRDYILISSRDQYLQEIVYNSKYQINIFELISSGVYNSDTTTG